MMLFSANNWTLPMTEIKHTSCNSFNVMTGLSASLKILFSFCPYSTQRARALTTLLSEYGVSSLHAKKPWDKCPPTMLWIDWEADQLVWLALVKTKILPKSRKAFSLANQVSCQNLSFVGWTHQLIQRIRLEQSVYLLIGGSGYISPSVSHRKDFASFA